MTSKDHRLVVASGPDVWRCPSVAVPTGSVSWSVTVAFSTVCLGTPWDRSVLRSLAFSEELVEGCSFDFSPH